MRLFASFVLLILLLPTGVEVHAQSSEAPVYARQRMSMQQGGQRGGGHGFRPFPGWPGSPYYGYFPYQPVIVGSWYARPYPQHLDYHQVRSRAVPVAPACPCEETSY